MTLNRTRPLGAHSVPVPSPGERARSLADRGGGATVLPGDVPGGAEPGRVAPMLHHVSAGADAMLLLPEDHPVTSGASEPHGELPAMLELADTAPVQLAQPVRGLLWITGWLRRLDRGAAHRAAVEISETRADPRLLGVNHGIAVLRLRAASLILADGEGTESLSPADFAAATPDPFCRFETPWLRHLEEHHPDVLGQLMRHVPARLRRPGARVRPLALDRFGLRLRVEHDGGDADVRVRFSRPVANPRELSQEIRTLLGCPFLRARKG